MNPSRNCTYTAGLPRLRWWAVGALLVICGLAQGEFSPRDRQPVWLVGDAADLLVSDSASPETSRATPRIRITGASPCLYVGKGMQYVGIGAAVLGAFGLMSALTYDPVGPNGPEYEFIWLPQVLMIGGGALMYFLGRGVENLADNTMPGRESPTRGLAARDHVREYARRLDASLARERNHRQEASSGEAASEVMSRIDRPGTMPDRARGLPPALGAGRTIRGGCDARFDQDGKAPCR